MHISFHSSPYEFSLKFKENGIGEDLLQKILSNFEEIADSKLLHPEKYKEIYPKKMEFDGNSFEILYQFQPYHPGNWIGALGQTAQSQNIGRELINEFIKILKKELKLKKILEFDNYHYSYIDGKFKSVLKIEFKITDKIDEKAFVKIKDDFYHIIRFYVKEFQKSDNPEFEERVIDNKKLGLHAGVKIIKVKATFNIERISNKIMVTVEFFEGKHGDAFKRKNLILKIFKDYENFPAAMLIEEGNASGYFIQVRVGHNVIRLSYENLSV